MALHETHKYDDIIDMPHHVSRRHPQMSRLPWPGPTPPATPISAPETGLYPKLIFTRVTSDARIME